MRSHLLEGKVRHRRVASGRLRPGARRLLPRPRPRRARRRSTDAPAAAPEPAGPRSSSATRTTGRNRRPTCGRPSTTTCAREGEDPTGWRITLVTNPRVFGYVFNPASFYLCRDAAGVLRMVIVEVHNTHLERHLYTLRPAAAGTRSSWPRWPRRSTSRRSSTWQGATRSTSRTGPTTLRIAINERGDDGPLLATSLVLARRRLTDRSLLRTMLRASAHDPSDDRAHPLARPAPVAQGHPLPAPRGGQPARSRPRRSPDDGPCAGRRDGWPACPTATIASPRAAGRPGRRGADPDRRPHRRAAERGPTRLRRPAVDPAGRRSTSTTRQRRSGSCSTARPGQARPTWTVCGPRRTSRP